MADTFPQKSDHRTHVGSVQSGSNNLHDRVASGKKNKPFYFICVFWGEQYWREFVNICLASLLSPSNIPSLKPAQRKKSRFLIVTTKNDWLGLKTSKNFRRLTELVQVEHLDLDGLTEKTSKMAIMSSGHKVASERAFCDNAMGVFLTPDLVLSDGSVKFLNRLGNAGKTAVLCLAVRFAEEGFLSELRSRKIMIEDEPMCLDARTLVEIAIKNIHTETKRYEWFGKCFAELPISPYWQVGEEGFLFYSFSWAPLLVDYSSLKKHDTSTFDEWTLDGDYLNKNFGSQSIENIYVVRDTDEINLVSFTRESDLHFDTSPYLWCRLPKISEKIKQIFLRELFEGPIMDDLKRKIFGEPVFMHSKGIGPNWVTARQRAQHIIDTSTKFPPTDGEILFQKTVFRLFKMWQIRRGIVILIKGNANDPEGPFRWHNFYYNFILPYYRLLIRANIVNGWLTIKYRTQMLQKRLIKIFF